MANAFAVRARCEITAPFGLPVVPDVYWMNAASLPPREGARSGVAAWPSRSPSVTTSRIAVRRAASDAIASTMRG